MTVRITEEYWRDVADVNADHEELELISTKYHVTDMDEIEFTSYLRAYIHSQRDRVYWYDNAMCIIKHIRVK